MPFSIIVQLYHGSFRGSELTSSTNINKMKKYLHVIQNRPW